MLLFFGVHFFVVNNFKFLRSRSVQHFLLEFLEFSRFKLLQQQWGFTLFRVSFYSQCDPLETCHILFIFEFETNSSSSIWTIDNSRLQTRRDIYPYNFFFFIVVFVFFFIIFTFFFFIVVFMYSIIFNFFFFFFCCLNFFYNIFFCFVTFIPIFNDIFFWLCFSYFGSQMCVNLCPGQTKFFAELYLVILCDPIESIWFGGSKCCYNSFFVCCPLMFGFGFFWKIFFLFIGAHFLGSYYLKFFGRLPSVCRRVDFLFDIVLSEI